MNHAVNWGRAARAAAITSAVIAIATMLVGCGMPAAPQPPSLNLPERVSDLAAVRNGDQVSLTWTMPRRNTDRLLLKGPIEARICRSEAGAGGCAGAGTAQFAPAASGSFTETLPSSLASGSPRGLTYYVELVNGKGRSAGLSNPAGVAAGQVPAPIAGLTVEMRRKGVLLAWQSGTADDAGTQIRLLRRLLTPSPPKQKHAVQPGNQPNSTSALFAPPVEPLERTLLVEESPSARTIDEDIRFNQRYEYRAQRVTTVESNGQELELAGPLSAPVEIETRNTFPPAVPAGLAAVGAAGENSQGPSIDLSWQPNTEADLAGYIVYRREDDGQWQRISPMQPVIGPAFHDANVTAGHTYRYAVSSIDQEGHESTRSAETEETAPRS